MSSKSVLTDLTFPRQKWIIQILALYICVVVVVCTDISDKGPYRQVGVDRVFAHGIPGSVMSWNVKKRGQHSHHLIIIIIIMST